MKQYLVYKKFLFFKIYLNMDSAFTHFWTWNKEKASLFTEKHAVQLSISYNLYYKCINK